MLLNEAFRHGERTAEIDAVHNYYENLVIDFLYTHREILPEDADDEYIADVACVALNHLPPRYIRFEVDMAFYLSPDELHEMNKKIESAVTDAVSFVKSRGEG